VADWRRFPGCRPRRGGQVHVFGGDWALALGPRLPMLYRRMEAALRAAAEAV
jgi:hypothetical protein